ncbi:MAG: hypothetical protein OEQ74_02140 [Gammaproteobacteria bacterium]|nr:hypothetical protein [Gammaproteobacteria bacterium]
MFELTGLVCWRCGSSLAELTLPLRRLEECRSCTAELHVCKLCEYYDTSVAKSCREPVADEVRDKEKANFCDYYRPRPGAYSPQSREQTEAQPRLSDLFGDDAGGDSDGDPMKKLDELFKKSDD